MKKLLSLLLVLLVLTSIIPVNVQAAKQIKLSEKTMELVHGDTFTLKLLNTDATIVWNTTNKNVATVTSGGVISANNVGNAIITAKVGKKKYTCKITVVKNVNNARPYDAYFFATADVLGKGFYVLDNYTRFGQSSFDEDFDTTLKNLEKNMKTLSKYNDKINAYEGEEYLDLKEAWKLLYNELTSLYDELQNNPPTKEKSTYVWLDFSDASKYSQLYSKECMYFE
jgi:hypothetical protein